MWRLDENIDGELTADRRGVSYYAELRNNDSYFSILDAGICTRKNKTTKPDYLRNLNIYFNQECFSETVNRNQV